MAKNNKADMSCARVKKYTASDVSKAERHNERKNESYEKKEQKHSYSQRIGKTTFIVNVKQSESAKKPLNTVFQDICKHEVLGGFFTDKSFNLENPQKVS